MHDNQRSIEGQSILRAMGDMLAGQGPQNKDTLSDMFDALAAKLDAYASVSDTPQSTGNGHLTDEKVAQSLPPPSKAPLASSPVDMDSLKIITGNVEATSSKEYKPGKYMHGIKVLGEWHTSFWKSHFDVAAEAKKAGHQVKLLYEEKPYKGKMSRTVQSVELA